MSMPLSPTRLFTCTACGAVLPVEDEHVGKKCRCGRCGMVNLVIDEETRRRHQQAAAEQNKPVGFFCRVCDTRMAARVKHVGKKAKCPDCGALTEVPPPPKPRSKKKPGAMHGQQYGLWGVDDAPHPEELAAKQPKYYPVWCRVCDTLMHAKLSQVGQQLKCPDCGAGTTFEEPPKPKKKKSPLVPDGQEYQLDGKQILPTRPESQFSPPQPAADQPKEELPPVREERKDRPQLPAMPLVQGVALMLVRPPVVTWFLGLTALSVILVGFMMAVVAANPIAAIPLFIFAFFAALLGLGALGSLCLAVLAESSEGNDRLYNPPGPVFLDWVGEVFYLLIPGVIAAAPAALMVRAFGQHLPFQQQALLVSGGWLCFFPFFILSCLENGSPLEPLSPRIFGSVAKRPAHWLCLIAVSGAIVAATIYAYDLILQATLNGSSMIALLETPLLVASSLLYFRVLGRFAWWLSDSLAVLEDQD